jgi:hypothetical protein
MNDNDMVSVPRSVLTKIQWCNDECAICHAVCSNGHKEDCPIGKALSIVSQHEIKIGDDKYVTKLSAEISSTAVRYGTLELCYGCFFLSSNKCTKSNCKTSACIGRNNPDGLNRIWVKAEK